MMTQISQPVPATPRHASKRKAAVDKALDTELFKALADPTRAKLLACLIKCGRNCSVSEVAECCAVDFSVVARHLGVLARVGVLVSEKQGRTVWYRPRCEDLCRRLRGLIDAIEEWCPACCPADAAVASAAGAADPPKRTRSNKAIRSTSSKREQR